MKITQILYKQHIGRQITKLWHIKRERRVPNDKIDDYLSNKYGIQIKNALDLTTSKPNHSRYLKRKSIFFINYYIYHMHLIPIENCILYQVGNRATRTKNIF